MTKPTRYATRADFEAGRKLAVFLMTFIPAQGLCEVAYTGEATMFEADSTASSQKIIKTSYGNIEHLPLGQRILETVDGNTYQGYVIDFMENKDVAREIAIKELRHVKDKMTMKALDVVHAMMATKFSVVG